MFVEKVNIKNYKCFYGSFSIEFTNGINIIVGNNESGKSTILEAIQLALSGILHGRYLRNEISEYLFNRKIVTEYLDNLKKGNKPQLPELVIEIFLSGTDLPDFEGNWNSEGIRKCGVVFKIEFDETYQDAYEVLVSQNKDLSTLPVEYYKVTWKSCSRNPVTARSIPLKSVLIDSSSNKYQNGSDIYISRIINNDLEESERVKLSQAYRMMKEAFLSDSSIIAINQKIQGASKVSEKTLSISVDLSTQNSWEYALMTFLDEVPFHQIGKGEQCIIKTNLALGNQKSLESNLVLLEEPENHLSHTRLNLLIKNITDTCSNKQIIVTTHSNFVSNKLGLGCLILLDSQKTSRLSDLSEETLAFFNKLPGYETLRLLLCRKAVLVEGDSDELLFQKAYMETHEGHLPIHDGIDVISVGLSFKRFLEIASKVNKPVAIIRDNDGKYSLKVSENYKEYSKYPFIGIFADERNELVTLEPQFLDANSTQLNIIREILGLGEGDYPTPDSINDYMTENKTTWALKIFLSSVEVNFPQYFSNALSWCDEN